MKEIPLEHFLFIGAALFCIGLVIVLTKKNVLMILMGIELLLNAVNINFVAFSRYDPDLLQGQVFSIFILVIAAAEAAVALALISRVYGYTKTLNMDKVDQLKG